MARYAAVQLGLGPRGQTHLKSFSHFDDRMEIAGICDLDPQRLQDASKRFGLPPERCYQDAESMLRDRRPDILSFSTLPAIRLSLVELAVKYGVRGLLMEKPMATSLREAHEILRLCESNGIRAAVCHQHKYLGGFRRIKKMVDDGDIGEVQRIQADCQAWLSQLGTHYMDYVIWANDGIGPVSVAAHLHGRRMLQDSHPSPDYLLGEAKLGNGVHATVQFGYFAPAHSKHDEDDTAGEYPLDFWEDDRLTIYGETGYVWAECSGRWGAFTAKTNGKLIGGKENSYGGEARNPLAQDCYTAEFLDWMDGVRDSHPCGIRRAYVGYEALEAMCRSALDHTRVDLPLSGGEVDVIARMRNELPEVPRRRFFR